MNDMEMTKLCAAALGFKIVYTVQSDLPLCIESAKGAGVFDPLKFDADAMALVKHFKLPMRFEYERWEVANQWGEHADLNRAIVEAVAKMHHRSSAAPHIKKETP